jgi:hypothetical protein
MTLRLVESMDWDRPSEGFLAYLERLSQACLEHNRKELDKLLRLRLSSHLPRAVLDELEYFRQARAGSLRAPLRVLRYLHQLRQLAQAPPEPSQLSLDLRKRSRQAPPMAATRRRRPSRRPPGHQSR